jgi:hypothetical protein
MTDEEIEEELKAQQKLSRGLMEYMEANASGAEQSFNVLLSVLTGLSYAMKMPFEQFVQEIGFRYQMLDEVHAPPGEKDSVH